MSEHSVTHATFVIERTFDAASPARVFAAFADPTIKARWFTGPEAWGRDEHQFDFRVGGREISRGGPPDGQLITYDAVYQDIVPNERIISTYAMQVGETRISVSVHTIELEPEGSGTHLTLTEQGAYLDSFDNVGEREHGSRELMDALAAELQRQTSAV